MDLGNTPYSEGYHSPRYWSLPGHHGLHSPNQLATYSPPSRKPNYTPTWSPSYLPYSVNTSRCSTPEGSSVDVSAASDGIHQRSSTQLASTTTPDEFSTPNARPRTREPRHSNPFVSAGLLSDFGGPVDEKSVVLRTEINGEHAGDVKSTVRRQLYCFII
jgi:hypothetical protein